MKIYHSNWLPLDEKDDGFAEYSAAKRVFDKHPGSGLLGGLDHVSIGKTVVIFHDRGMNGKTQNVVIKKKRGNSWKIK